MFSSSVAGAGSICLGCQLRAVTRRAAPIVAATTAPNINRRRRYASDSSVPASSKDEFLASVLNEKRHSDGPEASATKKKKASPSRGNNSKNNSKSNIKSKKPRDGFADVFDTQAHREASPFQSNHEVGFEDVWDQHPDPDTALGEHELQDTLGPAHGDVDSAAPVEHESDEIDYGSSASEASSALKDYSWNAVSAAELRQLYADKKYRPPKKPTPQPQEPPGEPPPAGQPLKATDAPRTSRPKAPAQRPVKKAGGDEKLSSKPRVKYTDNLFDWGTENSATPQDQQDDVAWGEESFASPPEQHFEEPVDLPIKHYRKGDIRLVEDLPQLSVETLGQDAPVIVLREHGQWKRRPLKKDERPVESALNIKDHVDQEEGLNLDVILENIDGLRPEHRILPARDFKTVFDTLMKGFTSLHLEAYIERNRQRLAEGDENPFLGVIPDELMTRPWIVSQSRWVPEVSGAVPDVAHPLKGYILKTMPPKQRLAMQLMRECWGMSVQELLNGQGVLELEVRDREFRILTLGNQRFLQTISRVHLGQRGGKSIQVIKSRNGIQIAATKSSAESCLKAIDEIFQKVRTKSVTMDKLPVKKPSAELLEELGRITNSLVELNEARLEVDVTWVDSAERYNSKLEDTSDVVLRLLLSAYPSARTSKALTVYPDAAAQGRLIEDLSNRDKLPWNDRHVKWARLCLPVATKTKHQQLARYWPLSESMLKYKVEPVPDDLIEPTSTIDPKKHAFYMSRAGKPLTLPRASRSSEEEQPKPEIQPTPPTPSGWLPYRVRTDAIFGHVFHLHNKYISASIRQGTDVISASRRTVSPLMPSIMGLDLPTWVPYSAPKYMTSLIVMRFTPTSATPTPPSLSVDGPAPVPGPAPSLELRIKSTDEEIIEIDCLRAIAHTHLSDICLPGEHVDVRATQRLVAELPGNKLDTTDGMQPLTQFLNGALLDVSRGRLVTPPVLDRLGLPNWLFYAPETDAHSPFLRSHALAELQDAAAAAAAAVKPSNKRAKLQPASENATAAHHPYAPHNNALTPTSYIFSGLEVHRPVETSYDGWKLSYTSIEAGAGGGRRAELGLHALPSGDRDVRREGARIDAGAWLRSVYKLATGQVAKGKRGDVGMEGVEESEKAVSVVKWVADKM